MKRNLPDGLYAIQVQGNMVFLTGFHERCDILDHAGLVMSQDGSGQLNVFPVLFEKSICLNSAPGVQRQLNLFYSPWCQTSNGIKGSGMLAGRQDNLSGRTRQKALYGQVDRFRTATGKNYFLGVGAQE